MKNVRIENPSCAGKISREINSSLIASSGYFFSRLPAAFMADMSFSNISAAEMSS